jgi:hypothetical protein
MKSIPAAVLLVLLLAPSGSRRHLPPTDSTPRFDRSFPPGEELVYEVSWWVVKLGTIRLRVTDAIHDSAGPRLRARADIDSYAELPFADLHVMTETVMDTGCWSGEFIGITKDDDAWRTIRYDHSPDDTLLLVERGKTTDREDRRFTPANVETLAVDPRYHDGLSILYYARANAGSGRKITVPTVIEGSRGSTVFEFTGERRGEEIGAVGYPVDVIGFTGVAEFSGIFGLSGDFEGWFSNDEARIPIRAGMGVILGSVEVELVSWRRDGWKPPKHPEE